MEVTVLDMMEARERRLMRQRELLSRYNSTLLCFTLNIPGPVKDSPLIRQGAAAGRYLLSCAFLGAGTAPIYETHEAGFTGIESFYVLPISPLEAKRLSSDIEEASPLGRLFDMDVLRPDGSKVERQEVGLPGRTCLICGQSAQACARSRAHSVEQLQKRTRELLSAGVADLKSRTVARLACQALLYEVNATPKPGLVDRSNSGSHRDMDIFTFCASTSALFPYFESCARLGMAQSDPEALFSEIRLKGRAAEGEMLHATGGVNTHKGAIFSMGLLCAAAGRLPCSQWTAQALLSLCAEMTRGLTERDFAGLTEESARTSGQRLYLRHGITGVRGQAEAGFPLVRDVGLPALEAALHRGLSINDACLAALTALMSENTDTNVISRSSTARLQQLRSDVSLLLSSEPFPDVDRLLELDRELIRENISPGGSADLLALCCFLHFLKEEEHLGL